MNPAYPGGHEILAAGRPDIVILQHAPARKEYDGFPGYRLHRVKKQIQAIELLSGKRVVAITLNHESLGDKELEIAADRLRASTGLPVCDVLRHGIGPLIDVLIPYLEASEPPCKAVVGSGEVTAAAENARPPARADALTIERNRDVPSQTRRVPRLDGWALVHGRRQAVGQSSFVAQLCPLTTSE